MSVTRRRLLLIGILGSCQAAEADRLVVKTPLAADHATLQPLVAAAARRVTGAPTNDDCQGVAPVALTLGNPVTFLGDNTGATNSCVDLAGAHVWIVFTTPAPATVTLDYCGTTPPFGNAYRRIMQTCPCTRQLPLASFELETCPDGNVTLTWPDLPAGTYYYPVLSDPNTASVGPYQIQVRADPLPTGACCAAGACYPAVPERACPGRWSLDSPCADETFSPPCGAVACCTPQGIDFSCTTVDPVACRTGGGTPYTAALCGGDFDCTLAVCASASGDCLLAHEGPGCGDASCCRSLCEADPFCCDVEWDGSCALTAATATACASTPAPWAADFDAYEANLELHGVDGWAGWDDDPELSGFVSNAAAHSPPHGLRIQGHADLVRTFSGINEGRWTLTLWQYIPSPLLGEQFLIAMNAYAPGGGPRVNRWSVQIGFNGGDGYLRCDCGAASSAFRPYIADAWVEIRLEINLDDDWIDVYYDGDYLSGYTWSAGPFGVNTDGNTEVAAIDLFANASSFIYYDDFHSAPATAPCPPGPVEWRDPPNNFVDARQPHPVSDPTIRQGVQTWLVQAPRAADPGCWTLCESVEEPTNALATITPFANGLYAVTLTQPLAPGGVTTLYYNGANAGRFTSHPANVNGDGAAAALDILSLIDVLNGAAVAPWGHRSSDIDYSGQLTPSDLLTVIDLLNGADAFDEWNASPLPSNTQCP